MHLHLRSSSLKPKQLFVCNINGVLYYFPPLAILQGNVKMFGKNVDKTKVEVKATMNFFFSKAFQKFHIAIWFCLKLEDVLEVLPMLMPKFFLDQFIFIWGHEQCSKMLGEISPGSHYYLKDLKHVYYAYRGKDYGKEDQTLMINDEPPNKALRSPKWIGLFLESFRGQMLSKNKVQWLDLPSYLWPPLVGLPLAKTIRVHYDFMVKYFKRPLSSLSKNYSWFLKYMYIDNVDVRNKQPSLGM